MLPTIIDFVIQFLIITSFLYAGCQTMFVFKELNMGFVLFKNARTINKETLLIRRLYALEFWLIFCCYIIYLGFRDTILTSLTG